MLSKTKSMYEILWKLQIHLPDPMDPCFSYLFHLAKQAIYLHCLSASGFHLFQFLCSCTSLQLHCSVQRSVLRLSATIKKTKHDFVCLSNMQQYGEMFLLVHCMRSKALLLLLWWQLLYFQQNNNNNTSPPSMVLTTENQLCVGLEDSWSQITSS